MGRQDTAGARRDQMGDRVRVQIVRVGIDLGKDRGQAQPGQRMRGGDEGIGRDDDLAGQAQRPDRDFQPDRAVAHRDAVLHAEFLRDPLFELFDHRPVVRQPAAIEDAVDQGHEGCAIADIGLADGNGRGKGWRRAMEREIRSRPNGFLKGHDR